LESFEFKARQSEEILESLARFFVQDYMADRMAKDDSGWRSLGELAKDAGLSASVIYGRSRSKLSPPVAELLRRGFAEQRFFLRERGRGGRVMKLRIVYDRDVMREYVDQRIKIGGRPSRPVDRPTAKREQGILFSPTHEKVPSQAESGLGTTPSGRRIAVLPLRSMSPDPNDEYIAEGMTEELITSLSRISQLTVIGRTSVMQYKDTKKRVAEISRELKVKNLIEGSVRKSGNRVRIAVQLLDTKTEGHLWAENYDRDIKDLFEIQSDVAKEVSDALRIRLLESEKDTLAKRPTENKQAHITYLKGRYHWNERTPSSLGKAVKYFQRAVEIDSSFAQGYAGLADAYSVLADQGVMQPSEGETLARSFAEKALELDSSLAESHATLGWVLAFYFWEWDNAELEFRRALSLNPNYPSARQWYGYFLTVKGRWDEGVMQQRRALELDPFSAIVGINLAETLVQAGLYSEGVSLLKKVMTMEPEFSLAHYIMGQIHISRSEFDEAVSEFKQVLKNEPDMVMALAGLGHAYGLSGRKDAAGRVLGELQKKSRKKYISAATLAVVEFGMGLKEEAFDNIGKALEERSNLLINFKTDVGFEDIRADQRFRIVLQKMGLPSEP
jgi:TolB-like protein/Flp pilus assembly protein TadD